MLSCFWTQSEPGLKMTQVEADLPNSLCKETSKEASKRKPSLLKQPRKNPAKQWPPPAPVRSDSDSEGDGVKWRWLSNST